MTWKILYGCFKFSDFKISCLHCFIYVWVKWRQSKGIKIFSLSFRGDIKRNKVTSSVIRWTKIYDNGVPLYQTIKILFNILQENVASFNPIEFFLIQRQLKHKFFNVIIGQARHSCCFKCCQLLYNLQQHQLRQVLDIQHMQLIEKELWFCLKCNVYSNNSSLMSCNDKVNVNIKYNWILM